MKQFEKALDKNVLAINTLFKTFEGGVVDYPQIRKLNKDIAFTNTIKISDMALI